MYDMDGEWLAGGRGTVTIRATQAELDELAQYRQQTSSATLGMSCFMPCFNTLPVHRLDMVTYSICVVQHDSKSLACRLGGGISCLTTHLCCIKQSLERCQSHHGGLFW